VQRHRDPHAGVTTITNTTNTAEVHFAVPMVRRSPLNANPSFRAAGRADRDIERPARGTLREVRAELLCRLCRSARVPAGSRHRADVSACWRGRVVSHARPEYVPGGARMWMSNYPSRALGGER